MTAPTLTPNAISLLYQSGTLDSAHPIVVQVLGIKRMASNAAAASGAPSSDRYRLIISDGNHFLQGTVAISLQSLLLYKAMVATQLNDLVTSNAICKDALIRLNKVIMNTIQNRRYVHLMIVFHRFNSLAIILDAEFVAHTEGKIGEPANIDNAGQQQAPQQRPQLAAQPPQQSYQQPNQSFASTSATNDSSMYDFVSSCTLKFVRYDQQQEGNVFPIKSLNPYMNK